MNSRSGDVRVCTTKVRTGCATCKRRRIKCDESSVPCRQCVKSSRVCDWMIPSQKPYKVVLYGSAPAHTKPDRPHPGATTTSGRVNAATYPGLERPLGGHRADSFNALPIECTRDVQLAFDNLFHMQLTLMQPESRQLYIQVMLSDAMFFESIIAYSKIAARYSHPPSVRLNRDIRTHVGNVLRELTRRVSGGNLKGGAWMCTVLTVYYLLAVYQAAGEMGAFGVHLRGLKGLRGAGVREGGKDGNIEGCGCFAGFVAVRMASADVVDKFLSDIQDGICSCAESSLHDEEELFDVDERIPKPFRKVVIDGKISAKGVWFLRNIARYLGRPYGHSFKDRQTVLLALRMVESLGVTSFPAHALRPTIWDGGGEVQLKLVR